MVMAGIPTSIPIIQWITENRLSIASNRAFISLCKVEKGTDDKRPTTLDMEKGIFYWSPGPGFIGEYSFVFVKKWQKSESKRKDILIKIIPPVCYSYFKLLTGLVNATLTDW